MGMGGREGRRVIEEDAANVSPHASKASCAPKCDEGMRLCVCVVCGVVWCVYVCPCVRARVCAQEAMAAKIRDVKQRNDARLVRLRQSYQDCEGEGAVSGVLS